MTDASIIQASISTKRKREVDKRTMDDLLYQVFGDVTIIDAIITILVMVTFATVPVVMLILFANYSGGMRWLLTLAMVAGLGILAVYLMKRGTIKRRTLNEKNDVKTEFKGQLTEVTEAVSRSSSGYVYSQQLLRERMCENIINKLVLARDLSEDEIIAKLKKKDTSFVGDEILEIFLLDHRRGTSGWEDTQFAGKGKSAERGKNFMIEIEVILDRIEEIV